MTFHQFYWWLLSILLITGTSQQKLVGYWGQNGGRSELSLQQYCESSAYDVIVIGFVHKFFDEKSKNYPIINLSKHCGNMPNSEYPTLIKCGNSVNNAIKTCQANNKKVEISLGGGTSTYTLPNDETKAKQLAKNLWNLYLGGKEDATLRPFGSVILDGVNLDIEHGKADNGYAVLVRELRALMKTDISKKYTITASPQCPFPDVLLKNALEQEGHLFDELYIQYYNNYCYPGDRFFKDNLQDWIGLVKNLNAKKSDGVLTIFIGLPAYPNVTINQKYYQNFREVEKLYDTVKIHDEFGGFMLWDAGWDELSKYNNKRYSDHLKALFTKKKNIAAAWGQNSVSNAPGDSTEASLDVYCARKYYDILTIFLMYNTDDVLSMDMSKHCGFKFPGTNIVSCDKVIADIMKGCQTVGKKLLITLGNVEYDMKLTSDIKAEALANNIWNMLFAGSSQHRPFYDVVLDGITIYLKDGTTSADHWAHFFQHLRRKMDADIRKPYTITIMTPCMFPNTKFQSLFQSIRADVDSIYVYIDNQGCSSSADGIKSNLLDWLTLRGNSSGPNVYLGLPSDPGASGHVYLTPQNLNTTYHQVLKSMDGFGGFFLWDAGWDGHTSGKKYSDYIGEMITQAKPRPIITTSTTTTTTTPTTTTTTTTTATPITTTKTPSSVAITTTTTTAPTTTTTTETPSPAGKTTSLTTKEAATVTTTTSTSKTSSIMPSKSDAIRFSLIGHWGQNLAFTRHIESPLRTYCHRNSYDVIVINALDIFKDDGGNNRDDLPGLSFSRHCVTTFGNGYRTYLKCNEIARDIKTCQQRGKKIILSIGNGGKRRNGFGDKAAAIAYASTIWNLFLGGSYHVRTFGREVLDGINIDISYHTQRYWFDEFIVELRRLMDTDTSRKYLITTTTPCSFPNFWLGKTYARNSRLFDSFFISFVDSCAPQTVSAFNQALSQWSTLPGPSIYIGLPANKDILNMGRFYMKPSEAVALYKKYNAIYPRIAGIILKDVSWDDVNKNNKGIRYSDQIAQVLKPDDHTTEKPRITHSPVIPNNSGVKTMMTSAVSLFTVLIIDVAMNVF